MRTLALVIGLLLLAGAASAHHFKGLPHFNYFENYPQVPQDEFLWQEGDFEFSLVIYDFQGIQKNDAQQPDDARLYLVVYSLRENGIYSGPLDLEILDHGEVIGREAFPAAAEENIYSMQHLLPETGKYSVRVSSPEDGPRAVIPFKLSSQRVRWGGWFAGVMAVVVIVVAVGSRRARVVQDRRDRARKPTRRGIHAG